VPEEAANQLPSIPDYNDPRLARPWEAKFLAAYGVLGNIKEACLAAGIERTTVRRWKHKCPRFAAAMLDRSEDAVDSLAGALMKRAIERDTKAAIFLLTHLRPEVFGSRRGSGTGGGGSPLSFTLNIGGAVSELGDGKDEDAPIETTVTVVPDDDTEK
jgi:hypothetical protein